MIKRRIFAIAVALLLGSTGAIAQGGFFERGQDYLKGLGLDGSQDRSGVLSTADIAKGLVEALKVGTERVVATLGRTDGFNNDKDVHIPLPKTLDRVKRALQPLGMAGMAEDLELRLNRAAEAAVPRAKKLFWDAITNMTMDDVRKIYNGPKDAATQYFRGQMSKPLAKEMSPIVHDELGRVGAIQSYDRMMGQYRSIPFVPDARANLTEYVVEKGIDGVFFYLAKEEAAIRDNPAKRTTAILQKVFGGR
ncbi:MAG: DUF4197 domain-containing protein [Alphaproteobacteria bacterium]|nr:DUF4197 domain-containing protein [Alphaproteobacteria bacterium]